MVQCNKVLLLLSPICRPDSCKRRDWAFLTSLAAFLQWDVSMQIKDESDRPCIERREFSNSRLWFGKLHSKPLSQKMYAFLIEYVIFAWWWALEAWLKNILKQCSTMTNIQINISLLLKVGWWWMMVWGLDAWHRYIEKY